MRYRITSHILSILLYFLPIVYCLPARLLLILLMAGGLPTAVFSQDYLGFANSAFAGVNSIDVNPALIVNSPRKWDITIIGLNVAFGNNYVGLQNKALDHTGSMFTGNYPAFADKNFQNNYLTQRSGGDPISVFLAANITLPSFMFIRAKHKDAFAFTCRTRSYVNVDGIDPTLAHMLMTGATDSALFGQQLPSPHVSIQAMIWTEYGITYGKTIKETSNERLNVAARLKFLQGIYAAYLFVDNLNLKFDKTDSIALLSTHVNYGHSSNLEFNKDALGYKMGSQPCFAVDLGATYEFHKLTDVRSRMASSSNTTPMMHEYKYKIGFSLQDLGWITYLKTGNAHDFTADLGAGSNPKSFGSSGATPLANTDDSLKKKFSMDSNDDQFRMALPSVASLQADYYAGKNVYVNSTINYGFQYSSLSSKIHEVTTLSLTPRWDWKWLGLYVPFSWNKYSNFRLGASVRLGPLIVGMADILPLVSSRDIYGADFHVMLKVPHIWFKGKNKNPRTRSKFDVNKEKNPKPGKLRQPKSDMPKRDSAPEHKQTKPGKEKSQGHAAPDTNREKSVRKHIFPRLHLFKKKNRRGNGGGEEHTIYFNL